MKSTEPGVLNSRDLALLPVESQTAVLWPGPLGSSACVSGRQWALLPTAPQVLWFCPFPQVRGELLHERVQRLEAQEAHFAESLVALQFQKVARAAETLSVYTALLTIQDLLLGELSESETLTKSACAQILESHSPVSGVRGRKGYLHHRLLEACGALFDME